MSKIHSYHNEAPGSSTMLYTTLEKQRFYFILWASKTYIAMCRKTNRNIQEKFSVKFLFMSHQELFKVEKENSTNTHSCGIILLCTLFTHSLLKIEHTTLFSKQCSWKWICSCISWSGVGPKFVDPYRTVTLNM